LLWKLWRRTGSRVNPVARRNDYQYSATASTARCPPLDILYIYLYTEMYSIYMCKYIRFLYASFASTGLSLFPS